MLQWHVILLHNENLEFHTHSGLFKKLTYIQSWAKLTIAEIRTIIFVKSVSISTVLVPVINDKQGCDLNVHIYMKQFIFLTNRLSWLISIESIYQVQSFFKKASTIRNDHWGWSMGTECPELRIRTNLRLPSPLTYPANSFFLVSFKNSHTIKYCGEKTSPAYFGAARHIEYLLWFHLVSISSVTRSDFQKHQKHGLF